MKKEGRKRQSCIQRARIILIRLFISMYKAVYIWAQEVIKKIWPVLEQYNVTNYTTSLLIWAEVPILLQIRQVYSLCNKFSPFILTELTVRPLCMKPHDLGNSIWLSDVAFRQFGRTSSYLTLKRKRLNYEFRLCPMGRTETAMCPIVIGVGEILSFFGGNQKQNPRQLWARSWDQEIWSQNWESKQFVSWIED